MSIIYNDVKIPTVVEVVNSYYSADIQKITTVSWERQMTDYRMTETIDPREGEFELVAQIERRDQQLDLCTIYQPQNDEVQQMSTWITAKEGSFVDVESYR